MMDDMVLVQCSRFGWGADIISCCCCYYYLVYPSFFFLNNGIIIKCRHCKTSWEVSKHDVISREGTKRSSMLPGFCSGLWDFFFIFSEWAFQCTGRILPLRRPLRWPTPWSVPRLLNKGADWDITSVIVISLKWSIHSHAYVIQKLNSLLCSIGTCN